MSAMEGFGKKRAPERVKDAAKKAMRVLTIAGGLSGAGITEAQAQSTNPFDNTTITLGGLAQHQTSPEKYEELLRTNVTPRIALNVALTAHSAEPVYASLYDDKDLQLADQVNPSLVLPLVKHKNIDSEYWTELQNELDSSNLVLKKKENFATEAVKIDILKDISAQYGGVDPIELEESVAYVARNLSIVGKSPTDANVGIEVEKILQRRSEVGNKDLFRQHVLFVSADELWDKKSGHEGEMRFGQLAVKDAIKERHRQNKPIHLTFTGVNPFVSSSVAPYHSTPETVAQAKAYTLKVIATSTEPLTLFLDGHGLPDTFWISGKFDQRPGMMIAGDSISVTELADTLTARYQAAGHAGLQLSMVSSACNMQNFHRALADLLAQRGVPLPDVMISASEYGQYGFSDPSNTFGNPFNKLIVTSPDLKAVMDHKHDVKISDPSVFVPRTDDPEKLMQISGIVAPSQASIG